MKFTLGLLMSLALLLSSCASLSTRNSPAGLVGANSSTGAAGPDSRTGGDTTVDISYLLGHSRYRLRIEERSGKVSATSFTDSRAVEELAVSEDNYKEIKKKVVAFIGAPHRVPASAEMSTCRSPFQVLFLELGSGGAQKPVVANGCRGADDGGLGRLVRDAEFLIRSKK